MNELLLSLKQSGAIPPKLYDRVCSSAGKTPLFYGLPKIHKPDVPLRPIASFIHSRSYHLSKHLVTILSPLVGQTDSNIQNSSDFAEFITSQTLYHQMRLLSHLMWYHCLLMSRLTWPPNTAVKVGVPKLGNCLEMYTCAQARAQACIHFPCPRSGQAVLQCTRSVQACAHAVHKLGTGLGTCVHFQAVSKLGHSNFYSSASG